MKVGSILSGGEPTDLQLKLLWWQITSQEVNEGSSGQLRAESEYRVLSSVAFILRVTNVLITGSQSLSSTFIIIWKYAHWRGVYFTSLNAYHTS